MLHPIIAVITAMVSLGTLAAAPLCVDGTLQSYLEAKDACAISDEPYSATIRILDYSSSYEVQPSTVSGTLGQFSNVFYLDGKSYRHHSVTFSGPWNGPGYVELSADIVLPQQFPDWFILGHGLFFPPNAPYTVTVSLDAVGDTVFHSSDTRQNDQSLRGFGVPFVPPVGADEYRLFVRIDLSSDAVTSANGISAVSVSLAGTPQVPEPSTSGLFGVGGVLFGIRLCVARCKRI